MTLATTLDGILDRRVTLEQPESGFRVAVDTVLLAASVPALAGDHILDMGCGVGGAMLALACRVPGLTGLGVDIQPDYVEICRRNIARNLFAKGLEAQQVDIAAWPENQRGVFDHALMNPPYHDETRHDASPEISRSTANTEKTGDLVKWIEAAALALKPFGTLTIIHRADRQEEILSILQPAFGDIEILPLLPKEGAAPKRIILRARRGAFFSQRSVAGLILHKPEGGYTTEADAILRHCHPLDLTN